MKFALAILLAATVAAKNTKRRPTTESESEAILTPEEKQEFLQYIAQEGKSYGHASEFNTRAALWSQTNQLVKARRSNGVTYKHNKFSDWTETEKAALLTLRKDVPTVQKRSSDPYMKGVAHPSGWVSKEDDNDDDDEDESDSDSDDDDQDEDDLAEQGPPMIGKRSNCEAGFYGKKCKPCSAGCADCKNKRRCKSCVSDEMTL